MLAAHTADNQRHTEGTRKSRLALLAVPNQYSLLVLLCSAKVGGLQGRHFFRVVVSVVRFPDRRHHAVELADVYGRGGRCWRCFHREGLLLFLQGEKLETPGVVGMINCWRDGFRVLFVLLHARLLLQHVSHAYGCVFNACRDVMIAMMYSPIAM